MNRKKTAFWHVFPYLAIIITACIAITAVIVISERAANEPASGAAISSEPNTGIITGVPVN